MQNEERNDKPGRNVDGTWDGIGIHRADLGWVLHHSKGVWMMLNKRDVLLMLATGLMIVIATECVVYAITGYGIWTR